MNPSLSRYFKTSSPVVPDGLQQAQREAIVDLLNFCRIADDKLVPEEEQVSATEEAGFNWESSVPLVAYAAVSLTRAEAVLHLIEQRRAYLDDVAVRLGSTEVRTRAICFCQEMFVADGEFVDQERLVFREIKHALGWPDASPGKV